MPAKTARDCYPVLPLRDIVVFPGTTMPLLVGRPSSLKAVERAVGPEERILLVAQRMASVEDPRENDLYGIGTIARIVAQDHLANGAAKLLVQGDCRARIQTLSSVNQCTEARVQQLDDSICDPVAVKRISSELFAQAKQFVDQFAPGDASQLAQRAAERINAVGADDKVARMQRLLEADLPSLDERLRRLALFPRES